MQGRSMIITSLYVSMHIPNGQKWLSQSLQLQKKTVHILRSLFFRNGLPQVLVLDDGPQCASEEFCTFTKKMVSPIRPVHHIHQQPMAWQSISYIPFQERAILLWNRCRWWWSIEMSHQPKKRDSQMPPLPTLTHQGLEARASPIWEPFSSPVVEPQ